MLCALAAGVGSHLLATHSPPQYDAAALLRVGDPHVIKDALGIAEGTPIENALVAIPAQVHQRRTARRAAELLTPDLRLTPAQVLAHTKASIDGSRGLVAVGARAESPLDAARIANAMAKAYLQLGPRGDLRRVHRARLRLERLARRQARRARTNPKAAINLPALEERIDHLRVIEAVRPESATLAQAAGPPAAPSGVSPRLISLLGAAAGLLVGIAVVALGSYRSGGIGDPRKLAFLLQAPLLSEVPQTRGLRRRAPLAQLEPDERRPFRQLVTRLRHSPSRQRARSVAVTSPAEGNGASTTAWYFAATAAAEGARTLLLQTERARSSAPGADGAFDVMAVEPGNGTAPDAVASLLATRGSSYDVVIVEAPPPSRVAAAIPFVLGAGGVVVVCRAGQASREQVEDLRTTLDELGVSPLGVVAVGFD